MRIYFCPECGGYSLGPATSCDECQAELPEDSWADITEEELQQLEYVEDFDLPHGISTWEYDVVRLKTDTEEGGLRYTTGLLKRCLLYTSPSPRDGLLSRMPSSA